MASFDMLQILDNRTTSCSLWTDLMITGTGFTQKRTWELLNFSVTGKFPRAQLNLLPKESSLISAEFLL